MGILAVVAFFLIIVPVTLCVALFTIQLQSADLSDQKVRIRLAIEGAVLGGVVSFGLGLLHIWGTAQTVKSGGHGSVDAATWYALEGVLVGVISGWLSAHYLVKKGGGPDTL